MRMLINTVFILLAAGACLAVSATRAYQHAGKDTRPAMLAITAVVIFVIAAIAMHPLRRLAAAKKSSRRPSSPYGTPAGRR